MREIKFRTWWKHPEYNPEGQMYFVGGLTFAKQQEGEPEYDMFGKIEEVGLMRHHTNSKIGWNDGDDCILMQYTGLKDKNGKEIYEGDIVKTEHDATGVVKWDNKNSQFNFNCEEPFWSHPIYSMSGEKEVIGNMYTNPELLK